MKRTSVTAWAVSNLFLAGSAGAGATGPGSPYVVGPNVQVSASQATLRHYEAYAGADAARAGHLITCAYVVRPDGRIDNVYYVSFNRGKTWSHTLTVPTAVDPSCTIGADGVAFAGNIHDQPFPDGKTDLALTVYRSENGGRTWQPSSVGADSRGIDRAYITADDTAGASGRHVYVHAYHATKTPAAAILFYASGDGGRSFPTVLAKDALTFHKPWFFPANGVVDESGAFYALAAELDDTKRNMSYGTDATSAPASADAVLNIFVSRDGGETLTPAGQISEVYYDWRVPQLSMPALAVDRTRGPFRARLYAAWPDARSSHRTQVLLSYSSDHGQTWSRPQVVSDDSRGQPVNLRPNEFMPMVAVNRNGVVGVTWYDRRDHADNIGYWVRFSASLDGGVTWLPSTRVSSAPHVASEDTRKNSGDTAGLTADAGGLFHPVWIDNRTGVPQMWTATVRVRGKAHPQ